MKTRLLIVLLLLLGMVGSVKGEEVVVDGLKYTVYHYDDCAYASVSGYTSGIVSANIRSSVQCVLYRDDKPYTITCPVTSIEYRAFFDCVSLQAITIPSSITSIDHQSFCGCTALQEITLPSSITSIGNLVFDHCTGLKTVTILSNVTSIGSSTFEGCISLQSIAIPSTVTSLEGYVFYGCISLQEITIPSSVNSIAYSAFEDCTSLKSIVIPSNVTSIGEYVFSGCINLKDVSLPVGLVAIDKWVFSGCTSLFSITIPNSVKTIGEYAFSNSGLKVINCFANTPPTISGNTFNNYNAILRIPQGSRDKYYAAPYWRSFFNWGIDDLNIIEADWTSDTMEMLQYSYNSEDNTATLIRCLPTATGEIAIPEKTTRWEEEYTVTSVAAGAFIGCVNATSIKLPKTVYAIGKFAFFGCEKLTTINIPSSMRQIQEGSFEGCSSLTNMQLSDNVRRIRKNAFKDCVSLSDISIGYQILQINDFAFQGCDNLRSVTCMADNPPMISDNAFTNYNAKLYVPFGSKAAYESAEVWKRFAIEEKVKTVTIKGVIYKLDGIAKTAEVIGYTDDIEEEIFLNAVVTQMYHVVRIADNAFKGCSILKSVILSSYVTSIGKCAFTDINSIRFNNDVPPVIEDLSFCHINTAGEAIANYAVTVYVPKGCKETYKSADIWNKFTNIIEVVKETIVDNIKYDYDIQAHSASVIGYVGDLPEVMFIPETMKVNGATYDVEQLNDLEATISADKLRTINIPASIKNIINSAFRNCSNLQMIVVSEDNQYFASIDGVLVNKDKYYLMVCPAGMTGNYQIPVGIKLVEGSAFANCTKLKSVEIPVSVSFLGSNAFWGCSAITDIYCLPQTPPDIKEFTFENYEATLHVQPDCKSVYENAEYWKNFTKIVEDAAVSIGNIDGSNIYYADGTLFMESANTSATVTVYTMEGKCVHTCKVAADEGACDLSMLADGIYIVRICAGDMTVNIKIVKK